MTRRNTSIKPLLLALFVGGALPRCHPPTEEPEASPPHPETQAQPTSDAAPADGAYTSWQAPPPVAQPEPTSAHADDEAAPLRQRRVEKKAQKGRLAAVPRTRTRRMSHHDLGSGGAYLEADRSVVAPTYGKSLGGPSELYQTESYNKVEESRFRMAQQEPLSTFSVDVDTASYSNVRRILRQGSRPPADAVRIEEMLNYFSYDYPQPTGAHPFSVNTELTQSPWNSQHRLLRIGLQGQDMDLSERPASNLVFLLDVSGSMSSPNKLPLLKHGLKQMVRQLDARDRVSIVVYAGASGLVLPATSGTHTETIVAAFDNLQAGGSTNGGAGIHLAYRTALKNFIPGGVNRVLLATDGDFNVGTQDQSALVRLVQKKAKSGVFLTVLGFGMGNYKDGMLEQIADKGNGAFAYIDNRREANKVLVEQMSGTLVTIAKDVKLQVEFNPGAVQAYRLVGYENRLLQAADFNDDKKDAGDIGAGHRVTALYEIVPLGVAFEGGDVDTLRYQRPQSEGGDELATLKLRYKRPLGSKSALLVHAISRDAVRFERASADTRFAAAVAMFGMSLRDSKQAGGLTPNQLAFEARRIAQSSLGRDKGGYRLEFVSMIQQWSGLALRD